MTISHIAHFECSRLRSSPGFIIATIVLSLIIAGGTLLPRIGLDDPQIDYGVAFLLGPGTEVVLPLVAVIFSYGAIATQRERGSLTMFLGAPHRRIDVLCGIVLGRVVLILGIVCVASIASIVTIVVAYGVPPIRTITGFVLITCFAAVTYTMIGISVSASVSSHVRAITVLVAGVFFFHALWSPFLRIIHYAITGSYPGDSPAWWFDTIHLASPLDAYTTVLNAILPPSPHLFLAVDESGVDAETGALVGGGVTIVEATVAIAMLCAWMVLSIAIGTYRFNRAELP